MAIQKHVPVLKDFEESFAKCAKCGSNNDQVYTLSATCFMPSQDLVFGCAGGP
jgi:hypothetical protein